MPLRHRGFAMNLQELAVRSARADFIEHEGNLSLIGVATLTEAGLSANYFENVFTSEGHFHV